MASSLLIDCTALIIDANPTSRSVLSAQLRDFGMASVTQAGRIADARRLLETRQFDVVLCEMEFSDAAKGQRSQTGQELLDELRQANMLPWSSVFIMVTGERSYAKVAEAAESALDSYLLKPFTAYGLEERVLQARKRKQVLQDIYSAIEEGDYPTAARLCTQRFRERAAYWIYAARLGAELLLRLDMHAAARLLLDEVVAHHALPWARLGIARVQLGQQQIAPALRTLESLIADEPTFADAYDVMGRTQLAQGHLEAAMETYKQAVSLTPGALRRQQKLGMLAFYAGDMSTAATSLDRAIILGQQSKMFDCQTLVLLAIVRFRQRDSKALGRCATDLGKFLEKAPQSLRLQRLVRVVACFDLMMRRQVGQVVAMLKGLAAEIRRPDFDVEAGSNLLTALAQLTAAELSLDDTEKWVEQIARRYAGARGVTELLANAAKGHPPFAELVRHCHSQISEASERSLMHSVSGRPEQAFQALLQHARTTLNQKFTEAAQGVLKRYGDKLTDIPQLQTQLADMRKLMGQRPANAVLPALDDDNAGGIRLRTSAVAQPSAPAPT